MQTFPKTIFPWPELPPLPPAHQPVLVRVRTSLSRVVARRELRAVLRSLLTHWNRSELAQLRETPYGPAWTGQLAGLSLGISLSYTDGEGWIGLLRGGSIGLDAMRIQSIPEAENLARLYLGDTAAHEIQHSQNPDLAFARAWTKMEARLKCLKQPLREYSDDFDPPEPLTTTFAQADDTVVAICTRAIAPCSSVSVYVRPCSSVRID